MTTIRRSSDRPSFDRRDSVPLDTNGDGILNAVGVDTTGDGHIDRILRLEDSEEEGEGSSTLGRGRAILNVNEPARVSVEPIIPPSIAVLFSQPLVSDNIALPILDCDTEYNLLSQTITDSNRQIALQRAPATSDRLRTLLTLGVTVLHYIGHGATSYIPFENNNGGVHKISATHLQTLLTAGDGCKGLRLVFVNSCFSRLSGETFASCGVPHVVCLGGNSTNKGFLSDDCAVTFMRSFYLAVCSGKTVRQAFEIGKASVKAMEAKFDTVDNEEQADMFTLLPATTDPANDSHDVAIFGSDVPIGKITTTPSTQRENLPSGASTHFSGRQFELYSLIDRVLNNRMVTLSGGFGMGKSTLAISAGRYLFERGHFTAVTYVKVTSAITLYADIHAKLRSMVSVFANDAEETREHAYSSGRSSVFEFEDERPVIDVTFLQKMKDEKILLILDGSEALIDSGALLQFRSLLRMILMHTSSLRLIVTTSKNSVGRMTTVTESVLEIHPLNNVELSKMIMMKCPTLRRGFSNQEEFIEKVSKHPALKFLSGNPYAVGLLASLLQRLPVDNRDLDATQELFEKHGKAGYDSDDFTDDESSCKGEWGEGMEIKLLVDDIINIKGEEEEEESTMEERKSRRGSFEAEEGLLAPVMRRRITTVGSQVGGTSSNGQAPPGSPGGLSVRVAGSVESEESGSAQFVYTPTPLRTPLYDEVAKMGLRKNPLLGGVVLGLWVCRLAADTGLLAVGGKLGEFFKSVTVGLHFFVDILMTAMIYFLLPS